jgi:hypothetical protein
MSIIRNWAFSAFVLMSVSLSIGAQNNCDFYKETLDAYVQSCARDPSTCARAERARLLTAQACGTAANAAVPPTGVRPRAASSDSPDGGSVPASQVAPTSAPRPAPTRNLSPDEDHSGKPCQYFTGRPAIETDDTVTKWNYYAEGANVCYGGRRYVCESGAWKRYLSCPAGTKDAADIEAGE